MSYTIDEFAAECRSALNSDFGPDGLEKVRLALETALNDEEFVATHIGPDADSPRNILYEDPDLGFCIISHVYRGGANAKPHDHGPAWALYGQVAGVTEMTHYRLVEAPKDGKPGKVEPVETFDLLPGNAKLYRVGDVHSPRREEDTRLIRIEGQNMIGVERDSFEAVA